MTDELIEKLVNQLFENGAGEKAVRLNLKLADGRDGGGWSPDAMKSFIKDFVSENKTATPDA